MADGLWLMAYRAYTQWPMPDRRWPMAYARWPMACGLWPMAYMAYIYGLHGLYDLHGKWSIWPTAYRNERIAIAYGISMANGP